MAAAQGAASVVISARIEEEISQLDADEAAMFLEEMGLHEAGLDRLIKAGYELLGLQTYFTVGPKEARAWTIPKGTLAPQAAGVIHGDFEKGFIRSETIAYRRLHRREGRGGGEGGGQVPRRGQDLRGEGRRRAAFPVLGLRAGVVARVSHSATLCQDIEKKRISFFW